MSTPTLWRYLINTFESNTRGSNVRMLSLSADTHAKLKAEETNPAIANILTIYEPVFFAYRDISQQYMLRSGEYAGRTVGFEEYMDQIPLKLRQWEGLIRSVYIEDSPEEKAIFPNKRKPFERGTYESRLDALGALKLKTAADPALTAAHSQITSFYNAASGARLVQQTGEGALNQLSDLRENQRLILSNELMGVLGQLMFIHRNNLTEVQRYFDLSLLRNTGDDDENVFGNSIAGGGTIVNLNAIIAAAGITMSPATIIRTSNKSDSSASFVIYGSNSASGLPGSAPQFTVNPGETLVKTVAELTSEGNEFINMQNNSAVTGIWQIEIIQPD